MTDPAQALPLPAILPAVSRSFHLSLRLLPAATRGTTALAYLLARAADTVADTRLVPAERRRALLIELAALVQGRLEPARREPLLAELAAATRTEDASREEQALLAELPGLLALLEGAPELERRLVRSVLATLTGGMAADLARFPRDDVEGLEALERRDELLDYCYQVAGCVGEFWSDLHAARLQGAPRGVAIQRWREDGVRLGRALQLTNVLRDVRRDLRHGRCYLPREELGRAGLEPRALLDPGCWPALRPLYRDLARVALEDARAGLRHVLAVPPRHLGLRLAELLPLLLALRTLARVLETNPLAAAVKVPRRQVYSLLGQGLLTVRNDRALTHVFGRSAGRLERALVL